VPKRKRSSFIIEAIREKLSRETLKVLVLCGGQGTKMRPLTLTIPKPMLPLGYKPILEHSLNFFKQRGLYNFILSIGYLGEAIIKYFGDGSSFGVSIKYSPENRALGTGGAIKNAENLINSTFIVMYGDVLFGDLNIQDVLNFHRNRGGLGTLVLWNTRDARGFGLVELDAEDRLINFIEKPKRLVSGWINTGFYVFEPKVFEYIPRNRLVSLENEIIPELIERGELFGFRYEGYWADIGKPEDYERISKDFLGERIFVKG
jgi:NDP-sugar pyrophosphorylase family protein